jgi:hypothetical protein
VVELYGVKYFTPEDISKKFPVTLEIVLQKIESDELDSCLLDEKPFVCEDDVLDFFTEQ